MMTRTLALTGAAILLLAGFGMAMKPTALTRYDGTVVAPDFNVPMLSASELHGRLVSGEALVIVDVRDPAEYENGHISGAYNVPGDSFSQHLDLMPASRMVVFYCTCPDDHAAIAVAKLMAARHGYERLAVLRGGLESWSVSDYKMAMRTTERGELDRD